MPVGFLALVNASWHWLQSQLPPVWLTMLKIFASMYLGRVLHRFALQRLLNPEPCFPNEPRTPSSKPLTTKCDPFPLNPRS